MKRSWLSFAVAVLAASSQARAAEEPLGSVPPARAGAGPAVRASAAASTSPAISDAPPEERALAPAPLPQIAAVVPGFLVHGSGTFLQGRARTTERFLLLEGASIGLTLIGGYALFRTGAARNVVGPAALTAISGVSLFFSSFLANVYAVTAPREGLGAARTELPLLDTSLGYLFVRDPQFSFNHFATAALDARIAAWHVFADTAVAPRQGNARYRLGAGYRFFGPRGPNAAEASDGSYLELLAAFGDHHFDRDGFTSRVLEAAVDARVDSQRYFPDVHGAFFSLAAGYARQWLVFDLPGPGLTTPTSLLLARFGFGFYVASAAPGAPSGEVEIYYDHRHDGFAAGLKMPGLGSGAAGHLGLRAAYPVSPAWSLSAVTEVGSAWTLGLSASFRTDG